MRTATSGLALLRPGSLDEALAMLRDDPALVPLAGGTDLYVGLQFGALEPAGYMDIARLKGLCGIAVRDGTLVIGAATTFAEIGRSPEVGAHLPMLVEAAGTVGGVQIQARGTLAGNIANASPAGDALPVLAAAEAVVVLRSVEDGERRVPFVDFHTGYRKTRRRAGELIVAVEVPEVPGAQWFRKVGTRAAQAISKVVVAAVRSSPPRIALGSVAPTPVRASRTEAALAAGAEPEAVRAALAQDIVPIDDLRSTAAYRLAVAGNLILRWWGQGGAA